MGQKDNPNKSIDVEEFLEFFLLDSQEQVDRLGSGLLQLEKEGENIALINDLFRSAHSLKGASGTMGFTPIVELTHNAEDLLDKLRLGKIGVTNEIIDVLLEVTDKVKQMLAQVEKRQPIEEDYGDLVSLMKTLAETGALAEKERSILKGTEIKAASTPREFSLTSAERITIDEALFSGKGLYQIDVTLAPDTMMKAA